MRMIPDPTGRFPERPLYETSEIEVECEGLVTEFLIERYGRATWPISTDDLTVLVEQHVGRLDLYADISNEGTEVEGVTEFFPSRRPTVRISSTLSKSDRSENRLRTTLTHELGHVRLHGFLYALKASGLDLFDATDPSLSSAPSSAEAQKCRRQTILHARQVDWMEWQAGYACGAYLMPGSQLRRVVTEYRQRNGSLSAIHASGPEAKGLVDAVSLAFGVSRDAATVRLIKTKHLADSFPGRSIFDEQ